MLRSNKGKARHKKGLSRPNALPVVPEGVAKKKDKYPEFSKELGPDLFKIVLSYMGKPKQDRHSDREAQTVPSPPKILLSTLTKKEKTKTSLTEISGLSKLKTKVKDSEEVEPRVSKREESEYQRSTPKSYHSVIGDSVSPPIHDMQPYMPFVHGLRTYGDKVKPGLSWRQMRLAIQYIEGAFKQNLMHAGLTNPMFNKDAAFIIDASKRIILPRDELRAYARKYDVSKYKKLSDLDKGPSYEQEDLRVDYEIFNHAIVEHGGCPESPLYRIYRPKNPTEKRLPTMFYIPETFFVIPETAFTDFLCSYMAEQHQCNIVALYPRNIHNTPMNLDGLVDDCVNALKLAIGNKKFRPFIEPGKYSIMGYGTGALLATKMVTRSTSSDRRSLKEIFSKILLINPVFSLATKRYLNENDLIVPTSFIDAVQRVALLQKNGFVVREDHLNELLGLYKVDKRIQDRLQVISFPSNVYNSRYSVSRLSAALGDSLITWPAPKKPAASQPDFGHLCLWFSTIPIKNFVNFLKSNVDLFPKHEARSQKKTSPTSTVKAAVRGDLSQSKAHHRKVEQIKSLAPYSRRHPSRFFDNYDGSGAAKSRKRDTELSSELEQNLRKMKMSDS